MRSRTAKGSGQCALPVTQGNRESAHTFDEPSEPERWQPLRKPNWLPWGGRESEGREGKGGKESRKSHIKQPLSQWKLQFIRKSSYERNFLLLSIPDPPEETGFNRKLHQCMNARQSVNQDPFIPLSLPLRPYTDKTRPLSMSQLQWLHHQWLPREDLSWPMGAKRAHRLLKALQMYNVHPSSPTTSMWTL